ncbi:MAG: ABC transporter ATP-binding protein [Thermofilaceae archaeon]
MLECRDLWVSYPGAGVVLKGVSLRLKRGEIAFVIGPNGAGKTTLLLTLAGLLKPDRGEVLLDGRSLWEQIPGARRRIGVLFQNPDDQLFNPTVRDELFFTLNQLGLPEGEKQERVQKVAQELGVAHLLDRPTFALSAGEKKRVALASILVYEPEILLLDEPTANLDPATTALLVSTVCKARSRGKAILIATQDTTLAESLADRVILLNEGTIAWEGPPPLPREVLERSGMLAHFTPCS